MKSLLIAATLAMAAAPFAVSPALADRGGHPRDHRECSGHDCRRVKWDRDDRRDDRHGERRNWRHYRNYNWNRHEPGYNRYYADRYYRSGRYYPVHRMTRYDRIYRGRDGRYYCRRSDGTTGLILGAGIGALLGNQLRVGGSATLGTILGGTTGALIGRELDRGELRCR